MDFAWKPNTRPIGSRLAKLLLKSICRISPCFLLSLSSDLLCHLGELRRIKRFKLTINQLQILILPSLLNPIYQSQYFGGCEITIARLFIFVWSGLIIRCKLVVMIKYSLNLTSTFSIIATFVTVLKYLVTSIKQLKQPKERYLLAIAIVIIANYIVELT